MADGKSTRNRKDTPMGRWLRTVRSIYGLDQADLGNYIGKSRTAVAMYESGERPVPADTIARIQTEFPDAPKAPVPDGPVKILGAALGEDSYSTIKYAGVVPCSTEWGDPLTSDESRPIEAKFAGYNRFLCKVAGESCYPALMQSDLTIWEKDREPPYDCIVLAEREPDCACTVKQLIYDAAEHRSRLIPINANYESPDDGLGWHVIARLVGVIRSGNGPEQTWYWEPGLKPQHLIP